MNAMEMVLVTSDYWGAVHGSDPGEALADTEGVEVAARLGRDMAWMVKVPLRYPGDPAPAGELPPHHDQFHPLNAQKSARQSRALCYPLKCRCFGTAPPPRCGRR